jgi:AraC family transcriptional regulator
MPHGWALTARAEFGYASKLSVGVASKSDAGHKMTFDKSHIPLQDPVDSSPKKVVDDQLVLWSSGNSWKGVTAEAYEMGPIDLPEFQFVNHNVVLHLAGSVLVEMTVDGHRDNCTRVPGDIALFPAGAVCKAASREKHQLMVVSFSQQVMNSSRLEEIDVAGFGLHAFTHLADPQIEHICRALKAEAESGFLSGSLYGEALGLALASRFLGQFSKLNIPRRGGLAPRIVRRVIDYIDSEMDSPLRMSELAEIAGLSQCRFAHNFKLQTGMSPHQFVMHARIERAKRMLRETNLPVVEIALAVGLQSSSRFNALFKRELGTTPRNFRHSFR